MAKFLEISADRI